MTALSSIFSSKSGLSAYFTALSSPSVLICVAILVILEVLARSSIPPGKIPKGGFPNSEVRQQATLYQRESNVDLLIVGSSVAAVNFPPRAIDQELSDKRPFVSFNGGLRGCNMMCISAGTKELFLSSSVPHFIFLALSPEDLDMGNKTVMRRSQRFVSQLQRSTSNRRLHTKAADISVLYGFQEHIRSYLKSRQWDFDPAEVLTRGHIDMGSKDRKHNRSQPTVLADSNLSNQLRKFLIDATDTGITVLILPVEGDSEAREHFAGQSRNNFYSLLDELSEHPLITLIKADHDAGAPLFQEDAAYIDNLHLNSTASQIHGKAVGHMLRKVQVIQDYL